MNVSVDRLRIVAALRPVTSGEALWASAERDALLQQVLARPGQDDCPAIAASTPRLRRRLVLSGGLAALLGVAAVSLIISQSPTYAATPPLLQISHVVGPHNAQDVLADLARRSRMQPAPHGTGRYHYIHTEGWYLHASADENNRVFSSGIAEVDRQLWIAADGSGRLATVDGTAAAPNMSLRPGQLMSAFLGADATQQAVRAQLNPHNNTAAGWTQAVREVWERQVVPPAVQAQLLDILAQQSGVVLLGDTTDRAGRPGVAVGADSDRGPRERLILVLDPGTGALLDAETVALDNSKLPVRAPATIAYTVWLNTGYAVDTGSHP